MLCNIHGSPFSVSTAPHLPPRLPARVGLACSNSQSWMDLLAPPHAGTGLVHCVPRSHLPLVASPCAQPLCIKLCTYPYATYNVVISPSGPKSGGQVHHMDKLPCTNALVEVRAAPSGRDGRDRILCIWEIRHGDPKNIEGTQTRYDTDLLHLLLRIRCHSFAHLQRDQARLPFMPVLLIIMGFCLRCQARLHCLKSAVVNFCNAGCPAQQRDSHRQRWLRPKAIRWSTRHFHVSVRQHILRIIHRAAQDWCRYSLWVVVNCLRLLHRAALVRTRSMLADPASAHTGLPRLRAVSPPSATRPSSPACERQRWPSVYRSDVNLLPLGHPSAGRAVRPAAARCPTVFVSRNTVCAARPPRPSWCIFLCILCLVLRGCEGADSSSRVSNCQKRSYFRAVRRAQQMGQTWYRGRRLTAQQLGSALTCAPPGFLNRVPPSDT